MISHIVNNGTANEFLWTFAGSVPQLKAVDSEHEVFKS